MYIYVYIYYTLVYQHKSCCDIAHGASTNKYNLNRIARSPYPYSQLPESCFQN